MPGRDRTGPEGMGPMTGRQMGNCNTDIQPESNFRAMEANRDSVAGRGYGRGACRGGGMGFRRGHGFRLSNRERVTASGQDPQQDDMKTLQERVQALEKQLAEKQQDE